MSYKNFLNEAEGPDPELPQAPLKLPRASGVEEEAGGGGEGGLLELLPAKVQELARRRELVWGVALVTCLLLISIAFFYASSGPPGLSAASPTTSTTTTTTTPRASSGPPPGTVLLHQGEEYRYYKVPVAEGVRLAEGKVAETCSAAGMRAICSGPSSCKYTDITRCVVTPLSTNCNNPMYPLSKILCSGAKPRLCPQFEGVFSYMKSWYGGECGRVGTDWCANGDDFTSGTAEASPGQDLVAPEAYFAFCAQSV